MPKNHNLFKGRFSAFAKAKLHSTRLTHSTLVGTDSGDNMDLEFLTLTRRCQRAKKRLETLIYEENGNPGRNHGLLKSHCEMLAHYIEPALDALKRGQTTYQTDFHHPENKGLLFKRGTKIAAKINIVEGVVGVLSPRPEIPLLIYSHPISSLRPSSSPKHSKNPFSTSPEPEVAEVESFPRPEEDEHSSSSGKEETEGGSSPELGVIEIEDKSPPTSPEHQADVTLSTDGPVKNASSPITAADSIIDLASPSATDTYVRHKNLGFKCNALRAIDRTPSKYDRLRIHCAPFSYTKALEYIPDKLRDEYVAANPECKVDPPLEYEEVTIEGRHGLIKKWKKKRGYEEEDLEQVPALKRMKPGEYKEYRKKMELERQRMKFIAIAEDDGDDDYSDSDDDDLFLLEETPPPPSPKAFRKPASARLEDHFPTMQAAAQIPVLEKTSSFSPYRQRSPRACSIPCPEGINEATWDGMSLAAQEARLEGLRALQKYGDQIASDSDYDSDDHDGW